MSDAQPEKKAKTPEQQLADRKSKLTPYDKHQEDTAKKAKTIDAHTGVACPQCGQELLVENVSAAAEQTVPPRRRVVCENPDCRYMTHLNMD